MSDSTLEYIQKRMEEFKDKKENCFVEYDEKWYNTVINELFFVYQILEKESK